MKIILILIAAIIAYGIIRLVVWFVFGFVRVTLKRRKIAKLDRLDRMDNGNRLWNYFLELEQAKQEILDKYPGQFPPGVYGEAVKELAWDCILCTRQNPTAIAQGVNRRSRVTG